MHGSLTQNRTLLDSVAHGVTALRTVQCAVCVPYPYLFQAQQLLQHTSVAWGAQNLSQHEKGAFTGEVSATMLVDFGCRYVLVGHSERRTLYGEDDAVDVLKFIAAQQHGLTPVLCFGETLQQREAGATEEVVTRQIDAVIKQAGVSALTQAVLAYEPVWAIGTGKTASPQQAQQIHALIRARIAQQDTVVAEGLPILYGGSVKPENAAELFSMPDIDGGLIGGVSLIAEEFLAVCQAADSSDEVL